MSSRGGSDGGSSGVVSARRGSFIGRRVATGCCTFVNARFDGAAGATGHDERGARMVRPWASRRASRRVRRGIPGCSSSFADGLVLPMRGRPRAGRLQRRRARSASSSPSAVATSAAPASSPAPASASASAAPASASPTPVCLRRLRVRPARPRRVSESDHLRAADGDPRLQCAEAQERAKVDAIVAALTAFDYGSDATGAKWRDRFVAALKAGDRAQAQNRGGPAAGDGPRRRRTHRLPGVGRRGGPITPTLTGTREPLPGRRAAELRSRLPAP